MPRCDRCGKEMDRPFVREVLDGTVRRYCSLRCFRSDLKRGGTSGGAGAHAGG